MSKYLKTGFSNFWNFCLLRSYGPLEVKKGQNWPFFTFCRLYRKNYLWDFHRTKFVPHLPGSSRDSVWWSNWKNQRSRSQRSKRVKIGHFSHFARCIPKTTRGIFIKLSLFHTSRGLVVIQYGGQIERSKVKVTEVKKGQTKKKSFFFLNLSVQGLDIAFFLGIGTEAAIYEIIL